MDHDHVDHPLLTGFRTTPPGQVTESFEVPLTSAGGIGPATVALARKLAWLGGRPGQHNVFVHASARTTRYTQALYDTEEGLWAEAVSNTFLDGQDDLLGDAQHAQLADLGFNPPDDGSPNHWQVLAVPVEHDEAAALMMTALVTVYGLTDSDTLTVEICPHWRGPGPD